MFFSSKRVSKNPKIKIEQAFFLISQTPILSQELFPTLLSNNYEEMHLNSPLLIKCIDLQYQYVDNSIFIRIVVYPGQYSHYLISF